MFLRSLVCLRGVVHSSATLLPPQPDPLPSPDRSETSCRECARQEVAEPGTKPHLLKTVGFRLTLLYCFIFILTSVLLFAFSYFFLSSSLSRQDLASI